MDNILKFILVGIYNLILFGGASYLIISHDFSAWIYLIALLLAASLRKDTNEMSNEKRENLVAMFFESFTIGHRCGRTNEDVRASFDELEHKFREELKK
jgi:hypothetical protein